MVIKKIVYFLFEQPEAHKSKELVWDLLIVNWQIQKLTSALLLFAKLWSPIEALWTYKILADQMKSKQNVKQVLIDDTL